VHTAAVFLDVEKAFDTTWHTGVLYKLSELNFLSRIIEVTYSFFAVENSEVFFRANYAPTEM
jgi:hypothetical protein